MRYIIKGLIYSKSEYGTYEDVVIRYIDADNELEARRLFMNQYLNDGFCIKRLQVINAKTKN